MQYSEWNNQNVSTLYDQYCCWCLYKQQTLTHCEQFHENYAPIGGGGCKIHQRCITQSESIFYHRLSKSAVLVVACSVSSGNSVLTSTCWEVTWPGQSRGVCVQYGGRLVKINDAETNEFIVGVLNGLWWRNRGVWIGLHDRHSELHWQWIGNTRCESHYNSNNNNNNMHVCIDRQRRELITVWYCLGDVIDFFLLASTLCLNKSSHLSTLCNFVKS